MRSAPPVVYPVGRFVWGVHALVVLGALGFVLCWPMGDWMPVWTWWHWSLPWLWLACLLLALWLWRLEILGTGSLVWDGQTWWLEPSLQGCAEPIAVTPCWDAGHGLLLRIGVPRRRWSRYAWLNASQHPQHWHALRCAVHASHTF